MLVLCVNLDKDEILKIKIKKNKRFTVIVLPLVDRCPAGWLRSSEQVVMVLVNIEIVINSQEEKTQHSTTAPV